MNLRPSSLLFVAFVALTPSLPQKGVLMSARRPNGQESLNFESYESNLADVRLSEVTSQTDFKVLPPDLIVGPYTLAEVELARKTESTNFFCARVLARLQQLEAHEPNLHFKSDYRQAWITFSFLQKGRPDAFVQASYAMYGIHPDKVWPRIIAERKERLGAEYHLWYDSADVLRPDVPPIPPRNADNHAAHGASLPDTQLAPFPLQTRRG